jgi:hypothetical protein
VVYLPTNFEKDWPTLLPDCFAWFSHREALKYTNLKNSNYSFKFYFMLGCTYPDICIAYNITSSDRSIGHYLQTL